MDIQPFSEWRNDGKPFLVAGPCSAETEEQLLETCRSLAQNDKVDAFRAGIWKPRTRPNSFEGVGEIGLEWFRTVREELQKPITTEVASAEHVELALDYGVDILWIGARSTTNPFTVQEIADALQGVDIPVVVKNPINPDLGLWIGALERIHQAGVTKLAALHRGFSSIEEKKYRNSPMWQIPLELRKRIPELPLFCDPSHIGGKRELIFPIAQKALNLNFDGMMIETHRDPDLAWSDAAQQVTPQSLAQIIQALELRQATADDDTYQDRLDSLRQQIDRIDREIVETLANRMAVVDQIGHYKKEKNVAIFQRDRWEKISGSRRSWGQSMTLSPDFLETLYRLIHEESIRRQNEIFNQGT
ncbi:MAG: chorismate mutase [Bernardetiaceae bacterium]